ncbi:hypothetical protein [Lysobacter enzymogenes]|uniref:hypothetical protein n=1 Tax=Lysobacter enzymogenes TaxID=69 RepID=UPI0011AB8B68|nr:hypothetical protein [Lysobacter enzymogenes]
MHTSSPPLPQRLRDLLHEHPDLIDALTGSLVRATAQSHGTPPFESAAAALEDTLSGFVADACDARDAAEASGDADALLRAGERLRLMFAARSRNDGLRDLDELWDYFHAGQEARS